MAIVRWDPWSDVARLRLFDSFFGERADGWMPAADVTREQIEVHTPEAAAV